MAAAAAASLAQIAARRALGRDRAGGGSGQRRARPSLGAPSAACACGSGQSALTANAVAAAATATAAARPASEPLRPGVFRCDSRADRLTARPVRPEQTDAQTDSRTTGDRRGALVSSSSNRLEEL